MSEVIFEKMQEEDLAEVLQIYNHYVVNTAITFHTQELRPEEMKGLVFFTNSRYQTFVANLDGKICGYVFLAQFKKREAYDATAEVSVYLKPGYEGKGIGALAIRKIEEHARSNGFHVLVATISGQNEASIRLFERNGFEKCAHYKEVGNKFGQWLDIVAFQKILR